MKNNPINICDKNGDEGDEWIEKDGKMLYDSRVINERTAEKYYGKDAAHRAPGYSYTPREGSQVILGEAGEFTLNGRQKVSPDNAPANWYTYSGRFNLALNLSGEGMKYRVGIYALTPYERGIRQSINGNNYALKGRNRPYSKKCSQPKLRCRGYRYLGLLRD